MNKELLIALIYKDLEELKILTKGFSEMEIFPQTLVDLSVDKAKNIVNCLQKLPLSEKQQYHCGFDTQSAEQPIEKIEVKIEIESQIEENPAEIVEKTAQKTEILIDALQKEDNSIAKNIQKNKVANLKQAFNIADRFRFQREFFGGNGEKFSQSLADFNTMQSLEQAQDYIAKNLKLDLGNPVVQEFIEILKRKLN
jgi:hypothetical protein